MLEHLRYGSWLQYIFQFSETSLPAILSIQVNITDRTKRQHFNHTFCNCGITLVLTTYVI